MEKNFSGYELERLVSKLRLRSMYSDADKLEKDCRTNYLSKEATEIVRKAMDGVIRNPK